MRCAKYVITLDGSVSEVTGGKVNTRNEYNELNQVIKSTHDGYTFSYTYDENGNRVQEKRNDGRVRNYEWDEFNRLIKVKYFDGVLYEYTYDGQDNRLSLNAYKAGHLAMIIN